METKARVRTEKRVREGEKRGAGANFRVQSIQFCRVKEGCKKGKVGCEKGKVGCEKGKEGCEKGKEG